ncbi:hypothetical protein ACFXHD_10910 [Streptomyces hydrogenans]|uniref:hypothetical protein n=1 Tax=Streptomyces hydrogenans TaxID=1873719 RepID=UPI0036C9DCBA
MALLTAEEIGKASDQRFEDVDVPEWGGTVRIQSMSGTDRNSHQAESLVLGPNGRPKEINLKGQYARILSRCIVGEDGRRLFVSDKQIQALGAKDGAVLERLVKVAKRVSGLTEEAVEDAAGKSVTTAGDSSSTD